MPKVTHHTRIPAWMPVVGGLPVLEFMLKHMETGWVAPENLQSMSALDHAALTLLSAQMSNPEWWKETMSFTEGAKEPWLRERIEETVKACFIAAQEFFSVCEKRYESVSAPKRVDRVVRAFLAERMFDLHTRLQGAKKKGKPGERDVTSLPGAEWTSEDRSFRVVLWYSTDLSCYVYWIPVFPEDKEAVEVIFDWAKHWRIMRIENPPEATAP